MKFPTTKLSCFPSLVNFLPHLIYASLTYDIPKLFLPLFNLVLVKTCLEGPRVTFSFPCNCLFYLLTVHIITTYHKGLSRKIQNLFSSHSTLTWPSTHVPWSLIFFSLVFLHDFIFMSTYNTSINLILTNSAILPNFTQ